ncbi:hypothetical protein ACOJIV_17825 [Haloarcula sp. AONF1]
MIQVLLQTDWIDVWASGDWFHGAFGPVTATLGRPTVVLLLGAPFTLALWQQTGSLTVPGIMLALFMGLFLAGAPAEATLVGYLVVVGGALIAYRSIFGDG